MNKKKKIISLIICSIIIFQIFTQNVISVKAESISKNLACNTTVTDYLYNNSITYKFVIDKKGYFQVNFKEHNVSDNGHWYVTLYDSNGNQIRKWDARRSVTSEKFMWKKGAVGYVTISIGLKSNNVPYDLSINTVASSVYEEEPNDSSPTHNVLPVNKFKYGDFWDYGDSDWYSYKVDKDGYFTVDFNKTEINDNWGVGLTLEIYTKSGECIFSKAWIHGNYTTPKIAYKKGTTLYIKVSRSWCIHNNVFMKYKIRVKSSNKKNWEKEKNNSISSANKIKLGTEYYGNILSSSDVDYFKYKPNKNGNIQLVFGRKNISDTDKWKVTIQNSKGDIVYDGGWIGTKAKSSKIKVKKGVVYYIKVTANKPNADIYSLKIK